MKLIRKSLRALLILFALLAPSLMAGCGVLFGTIDPVDERSEEYYVMNLSKKYSEWKLVSDHSEAENDEKGQISDIAYQSKKTSAIISLTSTCRSRHETQRSNLKQITRVLLLGVSDVQDWTEIEYQIAQVPALQTSLTGKMQNSTIKLRTVVLRKARCVYDFMYVTSPEFFSGHEKLFQKFVSSLKID